MKFKPLLTFSILLSVCSLSFTGFAGGQSENIMTISLENSDTVVGPDSVAVRIPISPDIRGSYCRSAQSDSVLRLAVILPDINGHRDTEFSRGFLMGLQKIEIPDGSLSLKMINGNIPEDSLSTILNEFNPGVIISSHEKETPKALLDYSQGNFAKLISVFDAKGEDYKKYPGIYQLLTPSNPFSENTAKFLMDTYGDHYLLLIGDPDTSDPILRATVIEWPEEKILFAEVDEFPTMKLEEGANYLIYPSLPNDSEIAPLMVETKKKMKSAPLTGIRVIGRPNWITVNNLDKTVEGVEVLVPSKCYFNPSSDVAKRFIKEYKDNYDKTPVKSYPVYSVMGYDAARYFIPLLIGEIRGTTGEWTPEDMMQSYFSIGDDDWNQGAYNKGTYILHYHPASKMTKDLVN